MEMSGRHRARHDTIQIVRTAVIKKSDDLRRPHTITYRVIIVIINLSMFRTLRLDSLSPRLFLELAKRDSEATSRPPDQPLLKSKGDLTIYILVETIYKSSRRDQDRLYVI